MPAALGSRVRDAPAGAFAAPEVKEAVGKQATVTPASTPAEAQAFFESEGPRWAPSRAKARVSP